jgi:hypothetical protein
MKGYIKENIEEIKKYLVFLENRVYFSIQISRIGIKGNVMSNITSPVNTFWVNISGSFNSSVGYQNWYNIKKYFII